MACALLIGSINLARILAFCSMLVSPLQSEPIAEATLVRVNIITEIRSAKGVFEVYGKQLDDYNPTIIQDFSSTGIVIDHDGNILTFLGYRWVDIQDHNPRVEITTSDGQKWKGKLIGIDQTNCAAVIQTSEKLKKTPICDTCAFTDGITVMTPVFKGTDLLAYQRAQILAVGTAPAAPTQHNLMVAVNHPFPEVGQPILTTDHRVLGFITGQDPADLQTFIYPIDQMLASAKKILKTGRDIQTGWLGVLLWNVEPGTGTGIVIRSVEPHSPADKAGLTAWDLLQKYNGKEIQSVRQLIQLVEETSIGSKADIEITREGNQKTLTVTIEARKPEQNNLRLRRDLSQLGLPSAPMPAEPEDNPPPLKVGLEVAELTPKLASFLKIPGQSGLVVTDVVEQSPAGRAGVRIGDAIVTLNGQAFPDPLSLASHFQNNGIDSQLIMKILRKGQEQTIAIQVDETRNRESEIGNQASKSQPQDRSDSGKREQ